MSRASHGSHRFSLPCFRCITLPTQLCIRNVPVHEAVKPWILPKSVGTAEGPLRQATTTFANAVYIRGSKRN